MFLLGTSQIYHQSTASPTYSNPYRIGSSSEFPSSTNHYSGYYTANTPSPLPPPLPQYIPSWSHQRDKPSPFGPTTSASRVPQYVPTSTPALKFTNAHFSTHDPEMSRNDHQQKYSETLYRDVAESHTLANFYGLRDDKRSNLQQDLLDFQSYEDQEQRTPAKHPPHRIQIIIKGRPAKYMEDNVRPINQEGHEVYPGRNKLHVPNEEDHDHVDKNYKPSSSIRNAAHNDKLPDGYYYKEKKSHDEDYSHENWHEEARYDLLTVPNHEPDYHKDVTVYREKHANVNYDLMYGEPRRKKFHDQDEHEENIYHREYVDDNYVGIKHKPNIVPKKMYKHTHKEDDEFEETYEHREYADNANLKKSFEHREKIYIRPHIEPKKKYKHIQKEDKRDPYIENKYEHDEEKPRQNNKKHYTKFEKKIYQNPKLWQENDEEDEWYEEDHKENHYHPKSNHIKGYRKNILNDYELKKDKNEHQIKHEYAHIYEKEEDHSEKESRYHQKLDDNFIHLKQLRKEREHTKDKVSNRKGENYRKNYANEPEVEDGDYEDERTWHEKKLKKHNDYIKYDDMKDQSQKEWIDEDFKEASSGHEYYDDGWYYADDREDLSAGEVEAHGGVDDPSDDLVSYANHGVGNKYGPQPLAQFSHGDTEEELEIDRNLPSSNDLVINQNIFEKDKMLDNVVHNDYEYQGYEHNTLNTNYDETEDIEELRTNPEVETFFEPAHHSTGRKIFGYHTHPYINIREESKILALEMARNGDYNDVHARNRNKPELFSEHGTPIVQQQGMNNGSGGKTSASVSSGYSKDEESSGNPYIIYPFSI